MPRRDRRASPPAADILLRLLPSGSDRVHRVPNSSGTLRSALGIQKAKVQPAWVRVKRPPGPVDRVDSGGEGGIRTHGRLAPSPDFESGPFNRTPAPLPAAPTLALHQCVEAPARLSPVPTPRARVRPASAPGYGPMGCAGSRKPPGESWSMSTAASTAKAENGLWQETT